MTLEDKILAHLIAGESRSEAIKGLNISSEWYSQKLKALEDVGRVSRIGDLPVGATTELCPPPEAVSLFDDMSRKVGWLDPLVSRVRTFISRYGWMAPPNPDERYDRSQWSGHAVRRVDFNFTEEIVCIDPGKVPGRTSHSLTSTYMVCGFLAPRMDKQPWYRATPQYRTVRIERSDGTRRAWDAERGRPIPIDSVHLLLLAKNDQELRDLALAVAYVLETRAILDTITIEGD